MPWTCLNDFSCINSKSPHLKRGQRSCVADGKLTNGGEDAGEAEVIDSV